MIEIIFHKRLLLTQTFLPSYVVIPLLCFRWYMESRSIALAVLNMYMRTGSCDCLCVYLIHCAHRAFMNDFNDNNINVNVLWKWFCGYLTRWVGICGPKAHDCFMDYRRHPIYAEKYITTVDVYKFLENKKKTIRYIYNMYKKRFVHQVDLFFYVSNDFLVKLC